MSIRYVVGNPGSGKTYLAVNELYTEFIADEEKESAYLVAYTNINEFDFSRSNLIKSLDIAELKDKLSDLHDMYLDKATDSELIEKATELELYKALIVIDECHSVIFDKKRDKVLIWWLTYHRHLYQDIWLITQNLSLVDSGYKKIAEFFYKAIDGSKKLFSNRFKYVLFNSPTMYGKKDIVPGGGISLKFDPEVYSLYHSGNVTKHKSYIKFYFAIGFAFMLLALYLVLKFRSSFINDKVTTNDINSSNRAITMPVKNSKLKTLNNLKPTGQDTIYAYTLKCFDKDCKILELNKNIPEKLLEMLIMDNSLYFFDSKELVKNEFIHFLIFKEDVFKFYKNNERLNDEKSSLFNPLTSGSTSSSRN